MGTFIAKLWASALIGFVAFYFAWDLNILALNVGVKNGDQLPGQVDILLLPIFIGLAVFGAILMRDGLRAIERK